MQHNRIRQTRGDYLTALIDNPRTSNTQRAAAARMMTRLHRVGDLITLADGRAYGAYYDHTGTLTTSAIAELIRTDIKLARNVARVTAPMADHDTTDLIGDAPAGLRYTVRTQRYAGGSSITVVISDIPVDWGWSTDPRTGEPTITPELRALLAEVKHLIDSYNHNGSDPVTDHSDVRFHGFVDFDEPATISQYWHSRAWATHAASSGTPLPSHSASKNS